MISSSFVRKDGTKTDAYSLGLLSVTNSCDDQICFMQDGLGSRIGLTDGNGSVTATYEHDAFGAVGSQTGTADNPGQSTGQQLDADSSLYFLRARYYDPTTGRFLSKDPLSSSVNPYAYDGNNPVSAVDPSGMMAATPGGSSDLSLVGLATGSDGKEGGAMPDFLACADHTRIFSLLCPTSLLLLQNGGIMALPPDQQGALDAAQALASGGDAAYATGDGEGSGSSFVGSGGSASRSEIVRKVKISVTRLSSHVVRSMAKRGWTTKEIVEAVEEGEAFLAVDKTAGGAPATRFVHPVTNKSIVVNDATGEIIHVGGTGFRY